MKEFIETLEFGRDFEDGSRIQLDVEKLVENLSGFDKVKVLTTAEMWRKGTVLKKYSLCAERDAPGYNMARFMDWQEHKEAAIEKALDSGLSPERMGPIDTIFNTDFNLFYINNGITRIRVYNKRRIEYIPANLHLSGITSGVN